MKGIFNLVNFSFQHLKSRLMEFWLWNEFFFYWGTLHAKISYLSFIVRSLLFVNTDYWLLLWQRWFSPLSPTMEKTFEVTQNHIPIKFVFTSWSFTFSIATQREGTILANTCKSFIFQLIPTKTLMFTLPKKLIWLVLSWCFFFVYQRKPAIHQKHFSWST